ncbi:putative membrane protein (DUF2306) [Plasmodiophora brassicae]|nr:hypothetical protein PBRA_003630 [Plasmodiophora brassicae]
MSGVGLAGSGDDISKAATAMAGPGTPGALVAGATSSTEVTLKVAHETGEIASGAHVSKAKVPVHRRLDPRLVVAGTLALEVGIFITLYIVVLPYATDWHESTAILYRGEQHHVNLGWIGVHITSATFVLIIGPVQLALGFLGYGDSTPHRWLGVIYVVAEMFCIPCAFVCSMISRNGPLEAWSLFFLNVYFLATISTAMYNVKARMRISLHRENMIRNYIGALVFATFRIGRVVSGADVVDPLIFTVVHMLFAEMIIFWARRYSH